MKPEDLNSIRGPMTLPGEYTWLWLLLSFIVFAMVFFFLKSFYKRRIAVPVIPEIPSWEKALNVLRGLSTSLPQDDASVKYFYSILSDTIRIYIEKRFGICAPEMTTEEFIQAAGISFSLTQAQQILLKEILAQSDMVKFAKLRPLNESMQESLCLSIRFVEETRLRDPEVRP